MSLTKKISNAAIGLGIVGTLWFSGSGAKNYVEYERSKARLETAQTLKETVPVAAEFIVCCVEYKDMMLNNLEYSFSMLAASIAVGAGGAIYRIKPIQSYEPLPATA